MFCAAVHGHFSAALYHLLLHLLQLVASIDAGVRLDDANRALRLSQTHHAERSTVLHWASAHGHVAVVVRLLEFGAAVDASDSSGWTALMAAVCNHEPETAQVLLNARADPLLPAYTCDPWQRHRHDT